MNNKIYGKTQEDVKAEKSFTCRQIISEILNFGVDESQKLQIIKLMAMELQNNNSMKKVVNTISEIVENKVESKENKLIL